MDIENDSTLTGYLPDKRRLEGVPIVDLDVHVHESPGLLAPYCEQPWRAGLEWLANNVTARYLDIPNFGGTLLQTWPPLPQASPVRRMVARTPKEMRRDLSEIGIDVGVLFPDYLLYHAMIEDVDYATALARAYNRWLVEEWLSDDRGLVGAVVAPHQDPIVGADEVRKYAGTQRVRCVYLPTSCVDPLYGHRRYDPLYDAAQECGFPVVLHSVTALHPVFPFNVHGFTTLLGKHAVTHVFSLVANLVSMLETGVPARFPKLKIAFTEGGIGWVPWIMMRLDKEYMERRREVPLLKKLPSEYIRQMYFATQPIEESTHMAATAKLIEVIGDERIVFASDWPHHDFDHPDKVLGIPLSDESHRKIMGLNALALLNLPSDGHLG